MTQPTEQGTIWVTQDAFDRLKAELDHLRGEIRADITAKIAAARDEGDLKENGGYHAAREEQGKTEARIRQLEDMLNRAEIGEKRADDGLVESGMIITVRFKGSTEDESFLLGSRELLARDSKIDIDVYSPESPLGVAILGMRKGATASYATPTGKTIEVKILNAKPF